MKGKWKSDAARTLAEIASKDTFAGEEKNAASQDLFGHMIHHWTCTSFKAYRGDSEAAEAFPFQIRNRDAVSFTAIISGRTEFEMDIVMEGECYKVLNPGRRFYEYFCPI